MISCNQKALVLLGLALAFAFSADASQVRKQSLRAHDPVDASGASDGDDREDSDEEGNDGDSKMLKEPTYPVKLPAHALKKEDTRLELAANLREQAALKNTLKHLTNESASDEEIEDNAKQVANETESVELGDMLSHMWKEMRMFDVPEYEKHVDRELHLLKEDEKDLEAELNGESVHDTEAKEEEKEEAHEQDLKDKEDGEKVDDDEKEDAKLKVDHEGQPSSVNFWRMSRASQTSTLTGSLVYLIGGILCAIIFQQMREKGYFTIEERDDAHLNTKNFSFPIFGCLGNATRGDAKLCLLGFCCPCLAWANTLERRLNVSYWKAFLAFFGLLLLHVYTVGISSLFVVILGVFYRQKLRESYGIDNFETGSKSTVAMDFLLWCFCQPCAIIQEAREEQTLGKRSDGAAGP